MMGVTTGPERPWLEAFGSRYFRSTSGRNFWLLLLASTCLTPFGALGQELPAGGRVEAGSASIGRPDTARMQIDQGSNRAILSWDRFSVGTGGEVVFNQPSSTSATLNRVRGGDISHLNGNIRANGEVFLINRNGVIVGNNGMVNASGFVASTLDIGNEDFLSGNLTFQGDGASAGVTNHGDITVSSGGFVAMLGGAVTNTGTITAPLGRVGLGAGERATLDLSGTGFLQVALPSATEDDGTLITNTGRISADGGLIEMRAATARDAVRNAINLSGVVEARTVSGRDGAIRLGGGSGGRVRVTGTVRASTRTHSQLSHANRPMTRGGSIDITGHDIHLAGAEIDASGHDGGGTIRIGGDHYGQGDLPRADSLSVDANTTIRADAIQTGHGGDVTLWADVSTEFQGEISARGGAQGGDGGFVEVSAREALRFDGTSNTSAPLGAFGMTYLDPGDFHIVAEERDVPNQILASVLSDRLEESSYTISTIDHFVVVSDPDGEGRINIPGYVGETDLRPELPDGATPRPDEDSIFVEAAVAWENETTLTLEADQNIQIDAPIVGRTGGLELSAGARILTGGDGDISVGEFDLLAGSWEQVGEDLPGFEAGDFQFVSGANFMRALRGDGSAGSPYALFDVYGLQGMGSDAHLASHFVLATDIDASGTSGWNDFGEGQAGFRPISQENENGFSGSLDGDGHAINDLRINLATGSLFDAGLFRYLNNGTVRNLSMNDVVSAGRGDVAALAGIAVDSDIENVAVRGTVSADNGFQVGGLLGEMVGGTLTGSSFEGEVVSRGSTAVTRSIGGLVAYNLSGRIDDSRFVGSIIEEGSTTGEFSPRFIGGVVGLQEGTSTTGLSAAGRIVVNGTAGGVTSTGGIFGTNFGEVSSSRSDVAIDVDSGGLHYAGGLVGWNFGDISTSRADAAVDVAGSGRSIVGGLVGFNDGSEGGSGSVRQSAATGAVTGSSDSFTTVGGLIGQNEGFVRDVYASGAVVGSSSEFSLAGGLVGLSIGDSDVARGLTTGEVTGGRGFFGGVDDSTAVASRANADTNFFDTTTTGQPDEAFAVGVATGDLQAPEVFVARAEEAGWVFTGPRAIWAPPTTSDYAELYAVDPVIHVQPDDAAGVYGRLDGLDLTGTVNGGPGVYVFGDEGEYDPVYVSPGLPRGDAGTHDILASTAPVTIGGTEYDVRSGTGVLTVARRPLDISLGGRIKTYGDRLDLDLVLAPDEGGLVNGDSLVLDLASPGESARADVVPGGYAITLEAAEFDGISEDVAGNYIFTFESENLIVDPRPISVRARDQVKPAGRAIELDSSDLVFVGDVPGFEERSARDILGPVDVASPGEPRSAVVGRYDISISSESDATDTNYVFAFLPGTLTVTESDTGLPVPPDGSDERGVVSVVRRGVIQIPDFTRPEDPSAPQLALAPATDEQEAAAGDALVGVTRAAGGVEAAVETCRQSEPQVADFLACVAEALDTFASEIDAIEAGVPAEMAGIVKVLRDLSDSLDAQRQVAELRLAGATTEAERQQIRREVIAQAVVTVDAAEAVIAASVGMIRASDPELEDIYRAQAGVVLNAVGRVEDTMTRAFDL